MHGHLGRGTAERGQVASSLVFRREWKCPGSSIFALFTRIPCCITFTCILCRDMTNVCVASGSRTGVQTRGHGQ